MTDEYRQREGSLSALKILSVNVLRLNQANAEGLPGAVNSRRGARPAIRNRR